MSADGVDPDVIAKIAKLKERLEHRAQGGQIPQTEAELEAVAAAMQRLLAKHKLSLTDVEYATIEREEPVAERLVDPRKLDPTWKHKRQRSDWEERLASIVAKAHFCRIVVHPGHNMISLVGRRSDADVAEYMIVTLQRSIARIADDAYGKHARACLKAGDVTQARGFRPAFLRAFVMRLAERYEAQRREQEGGSTTALVRFDSARQAVEDFLAAKRADGAHSLTRAPRGREAHNAEGHRQGTAAADSVNLRANAVGGGDRPRGSLR
jgi:hypothetical protein